MALDPRTPVIVGVGQLTQRTDQGEPVLEPVDMMAEAARRAEADSGGRGVLAAAQTVRCIRQASWPYGDAARLVAERVGAAGASTGYTNNGGQIVGALVAETAAEIAAGSLDVALLVGGEAWRTVTAAKRAGTALHWSHQPEGTVPDRIFGAPLEHRDPAEVAIGANNPINIYPVLENALRAAAGRSVADHRAHLGRLYAGFSAVAVQNPYAWDRHPYTAEEIATPGPGNRMVGFPYTKLMCSNEQVDEAAAILLCSVERATALGIPDDRWVFPYAGASGEAPTVTERPNLAESPMLDATAALLWQLAGVGPGDVAHADLYSCFPSAVQAQAFSFGLGLDRPLTVTGGMRFSGGPWNNYPMHGLAAMVGVLRRDAGAVGLCTANGGYVTKQVAVVYSTTPPSVPFRFVAADLAGLPRRPVVTDAAGPLTVESYTVMHGRSGEAEEGFVLGSMADGARAWGRITDPATLADMERDEVIGLKAERRADGAASL
jgi:acetyl-CoA C-acetyltransferase